jgi:hypothetical protein
VTEFKTRNLTAEESTKLVSALHSALGYSEHVTSVLRVIADQGLGVFVAEPIEPKGSVLIIGQNRYGYGVDTAEAKKNFRAQGGVLSNGYAMVTFPSELTYKGVDELGRVHWEGKGEPDVVEVAMKTKVTKR